MTAGNKQLTFEQIPITTLKGVGPKLAEKLDKLGIRVFRDLLFHLPLRYLDQTHITPIGRLKPGVYAVVEAEITDCKIAYGKRRSLVCSVSDDTGTSQLRFFHFSAAQKDRLQVGQSLRILGEPRRGQNGLEFYHPETTLLSDDTPLPESLTPIYPSTEGVSQKKWLQLTEQLLVKCQNQPLNELIPVDLRSGTSHSSLNDTLIFLHRPPTEVDADELSRHNHPLQRRLAFEELLAHHVTMKHQRKQNQGSACALLPAGELTKQLLKQLPFFPTAAQTRVHQQVSADLSRPVPTRRLVQGDVGSGKTLIGALATLPVVQADKQVAVMAPTEILAEQHFENFRRWLEPLNITVGWLCGKQPAKERQQTLAMIAIGAIQVVVGTQALFQDAVVFSDLSLVIIDEQHRFGVYQRLALQQKNQYAKPHLLLLTATPIPRTLAMSIYSSIDISVIDELPPGRKPVDTATICNDRRQDVIDRIGRACKAGRQAYWVCTLIEESETLQAQAVEELWEDLKQALPNVTIGLVHGRMSSSENDEQMARFKRGKTQLLVATTVIEVGVDVPNASLIIIENPERLGLAQLHQLRGRVGRGDIESHCVLLYQLPLGKIAKQRLRIMKTTNDGFVIAEEDLKLRGPGEVLGTRQTGDIQFRIADLSQHQDLLEQVEEIGEIVFDQHPELISPLAERWLSGKQLFADA